MRAGILFWFEANELHPPMLLAKQTAIDLEGCLWMTYGTVLSRQPLTETLAALLCFGD